MSDEQLCAVMRALASALKQTMPNGKSYRITLHYRNGSYRDAFTNEPVLGFCAEVFMYHDDGPVWTVCYPTIEECLLEACRVANVID